ncbi:hypothetical protein VVD49_14070 [Uliginosibacterium sp. H3]|uniref:Uncharacterized protein n=1 Tax=Uliginosibacterium silvisoli TaxID=3114758 RepID=A0ABU6K5J5_9RHOO|nr:hypothetical protein [Uliginosibacterium sp. H3]
MHPIHDSDIQLLLATTVAAKRKPARIAEIISALDLLHGSIPSAAKLSEAFARLGTNGLLQAIEDGFTLTAEAQKMLASQPRRAALAEHTFSLKEQLAAYKPTPVAANAIAIIPAEIEAAIRAHRAPVQGVGKNLLMPIRSKETDNKRAGSGRRPASRKR